MNSVDIRAAFCFEQCDRGPTVTVDGERLEHCTLEAARDALDRAFERGHGEPVPAISQGGTHDSDTDGNR